MATIDKYSGPWTEKHAAHLLRRTCFGADLQTIKSFAEKSLDQCIGIIFSPLPDPEPPVNTTFENDPNVPIGTTWVDKAVTAGVNGYRTTSLRNWTFEQMLSAGPNIREKMTLFWHNHFVTADINDPRHSYKYISLLRKFATGDFRQLTKEITIDPAMLIYLNGRDNTRQAPNENYARELMELFTLGKGNVAGPGDYTTFTEDDVREMAKCLTGWVVPGDLPVRSEFRPNRHDTGVKKLSHRFNNINIPNAGAGEYKNLIDIIFTREEVAVFIAKKLYIWFVGAQISEQVMEQVILPMAELIRIHEYNIAPALQALLSSAHFFDDCNRGNLIRNPIDFLVNPLLQFNITITSDPLLRQRVLNGLYQSANAMQMGLYQAPSVAGWQAFYQEPAYYRLWLNATSLPARKLYTDAIATTGIAYSSYRLQINVLTFLDSLSDPKDPDRVIDDLSLVLYPKSLAANQKTVLRNLLLNGTTPQGWATFYDNYRSNPNSNTNRQALESRLRPLLAYMMRMPEIHLS